MDKSPEYIGMCRLANEIQHRWQQSYGDFFVTESGRIECWLPAKRPTEVVKRGYGVCAQQGVIRIARYTWLPRQDQLIEMAQENGRRYESVTQEFFNWAKHPYGRQQEPPSKLFRSMEKIWLAFVMHKNYWKKWDFLVWKRELYRRHREGE
jgi:hypothetical protein